MRLHLVRGDIITVAADAIVNAASPAMRGGGGVDGAVHRAAGPALLRECIERFPNGLSTGSAGWTSAGGLNARWVIHVVGPNRHLGQADPQLLASCYRSALAVADELGVRSMASPLVSAGVYGWPVDDAANIAVRTLNSTPTSVQEVTMVAFNDPGHAAVRAALRAAEAPRLRRT